jgi:hypothetical protein
MLSLDGPAEQQIRAMNPMPSEKTARGASSEVLQGKSLTPPVCVCNNMPYA